ncbi:hypothetical protein CRU99_13090 [Malaciobacter mytili]|uniref:hypothetical protein n=1 Tax=Malaciobacter mytili TaxID=603050 RepID=UPI00100A6FC8|nr:hypothetical protein [Malaciobacter mytili]RXI36936.1 hypothetical protein CRU99_13090 [Malaciobacter mytili]
MEGSKLIVFATFIGLVAFVFTSVPFMASILGGILKDEKNNNDKSINEILFKAFSLHIISVLSLITLFSMLDIFLNNIEANFLKIKCMQEIFWLAENKETVFLNANAIAGSYQAEGAYSFLKSTYILIQIFYALLPIFIVILSSFVGWKVNKSKQDNTSFNILLNQILYITLGLFIYYAWIWTADIGMYLPVGMNLYDIKNEYWKTIFNLS